MTASSMIRVEGLRFAYGTDAFGIEIPSLDIARGEHVACIGPSGSGKTTLVNLISGILTPDAGSVAVGGEMVSSLPDAARRALRIAKIGMVFQEFELLDYLTALENVTLPYHVTPHLELGDTVRDRARQLARTMGIEGVLARRPRHLSQGERQRVAICRALVTSPGLIMCDEPTGNLDPDTATRTLDLLFAQVRDHGATLMMVTHNHGILDRFDRVIDMRELTGLIKT